VFVRIHTHAPTYTPTRVKNKEDTDKTDISREVKVAFIIAQKEIILVVLFGTLEVLSFLLTKVSDCSLLIVVKSSTFLKRKDMLKEKKAVSPDHLNPQPSIYTGKCTLYTYTVYMYTAFGRSGFFQLSRCLIPTPELISEYSICAVCVCVCIYTHVHPHTLPPALKIEKTQTTPLSFLLSKITPRAKQQVPS